MADYLLYAATLIPLLLFVLAVHEAGHFWTARRLGMHAAGFQIGLGPALYTRYCGRIKLRLPAGGAQALPCHNRSGKTPTVGDRAALAVQPDPANPRGLQATAWLPAHKRDWPDRSDPSDNPKPRSWPDIENRLQNLSDAKRFTQERPVIQGKLVELTTRWAVLAPTAFTLRPIPIAAGVMLPEDPTGQAPGFYNNASWPRRAAVILAGPLANLFLMLLALLLLTLLPPPNLRLEVLEVTAVAAASPAAAAGFQPGDRILYAGRTALLPNRASLQAVRDKAARQNSPWTVDVARGAEDLKLTLPPLPPEADLGLTLTAQPANRRSYPRSPREAALRFARLNQTYYEAFAQLARLNRAALDDISSPVMVTHQLGQVLPRAGWPAWLAVLAAVSLTAALLNLFPVPPMDGYRLTAETIRSLRGGKTLNPRVEGIMLFYGAALILLTGLYLAFRDVIRIVN